MALVSPGACSTREDWCMDQVTAPAAAHQPISDLASRLYPPAKPAAPVVAAPTPAPAEARQAHADVLYPAKAAPIVDAPPEAEVQALRDAEPARKMYRDDLQLGSTHLREIVLASADPDITEAQIAKASTIMASVFVDAGLNRDDLQRMSATARTLARSPPTAEQEKANAREAALVLRGIYGSKDFDLVLRDAMHLATRDSRMKTYLAKTGLGSDVATVVRFAELARAQKASGRLKVPT